MSGYYNERRLRCKEATKTAGRENLNRYVYFPICDEGLPDLNKLHAMAKLGARLVANGEKVLAHCGMGFNRSVLVAGLVLTYLGMKGEDAVALLREKRPGALFNENFAAYLTALPPNTSAPDAS